MIEKTVLVDSVRCHHDCPLCGHDKPHQATIHSPCVFLKFRICDDCVLVQLQLIEPQRKGERS
jgi:hypothetical protein